MSERASFLERLWLLIISNFGTKSVSVVIAVVLWGIVLGSRNVEVIKEIPLEVITPADIVPANDIPDRIAFRLSGPKAFLRGILNRREEPIRVNLSGAKPALVTYRFFSDNIRIPIGVKVLSINPSAIPIKLEYLKRRAVPIRADIRGTPADGFRIIKTEVKPDIVRIKGAESRVDGITEISTVPVDVTGLNKSINKEVSINLDHYNVQLDSELPRIIVDIESIFTHFKIKNVDIHVLTSYKVKVEEKSVTVFVRATPQDLQALDRTQIFGVVDLLGKAKGRYTEPVKVTLPKNMGFVSVVPDHVNIVLY